MAPSRAEAAPLPRYSNSVRFFVKRTRMRRAGMSDRRKGRRRAVGEMKRELILDAARRVFEAEGLDGASLRAIAAAAGYTPAALYFHFDSKEAIYAEVLRASLARLGEHVASAVAAAKAPADRLRAAAMAFFRFYDEN